MFVICWVNSNSYVMCDIRVQRSTDFNEQHIVEILKKKSLKIIDGII